MQRRSSTDATTNAQLHERVDAVVETIRPAAQKDGGDIELVRVDDEGVVYIRLHGACIDCPSSELTLTMGVERTLREAIPEILRVERVE